MRDRREGLEAEDGFVLFMFITWVRTGLWSFGGDALACNCTLPADGQQRFDDGSRFPAAAVASGWQFAYDETRFGRPVGHELIRHDELGLRRRFSKMRRSLEIDRFLPAVVVLLSPCLLGHAAEGPTRAELALELLFEGDLADTSAAKRAGKAQGEVALVEGKRGLCASFDGRSWIDTGFPQTELGDEFTVECWVNPGSTQGVHADIFGNHASEGLGFVLQQDSSNTNQFLGAYGAGDGKWVTTDAAPLAAGRWQHVALVKTSEELRVYFNGVLVALEEDPAPCRPSPMPVAVGLGYSAQERCFRGLIDDFRIWNRALSDFGHAEIDPALARETRSQCLQAAPRPAADAVTKSWTVATDDTRLTLGVTAAGELVVGELSCPATGWNWITHPVVFGFLSQVAVDGQSKKLRWRLVDAAVEESEGRKLTLRFACDEPALEITSQWHARPGPGPVHHAMFLRNRSAHPVTVGEQPTFDLDLTGADAMWCFHSDGGRPDPVGVYRHPLSGEPAGRRYTARAAPNGGFIPYAVFESDEGHGVYLGLEWSFCRIETVTLSGVASPTVRVRGGNVADVSLELGPGEVFEVRPGFLGAYCGDLDDAGNRLRRWLMRYCVPEVLRKNPDYPKVQWNAFAATGKAPMSWDPVEAKFYPLIDDIASLGFEEVMIDVGWWQGGEPDSDELDWPRGMKTAADYAHQNGMRFGLYWTDDADMATPRGREVRARRIKSLFLKHGADLWRSDNTSGAVIESNYLSVKGFYDLVDGLQRDLPNFQWENCSSGGRIKDHGAMKRSVKIFMSDGFSVLHVRQTFYDGSFAFHPIQLMGHLGVVDGPPRRPYRPRGIDGMRFAFRAMSMGAPEWFLDAPNGGNAGAPWTEEERETVKRCVETYKSKIRPLVREADLYHVFPRPDGQNRDGIEYYDPAAGRGVVYLFQPTAETSNEPIRFKGLDPERMYRVSFEDGTQPPSVRSGAELMGGGLPVEMEGEEASELIFFEVAR